MLAVCRADGKIRVQLEVFIDRQAAARFNSGKDQLRDDLLIRIEGRDDLRVSFRHCFYSAPRSVRSRVYM